MSAQGKAADVITVDVELVVLLSPFVVGLVEGAKRAGLPSKSAGPAALVFAFALTALVAEDPTSRSAALTAIATGLAASGLYSSGKSLLEVLEMKNAA